LGVSVELLKFIKYSKNKKVNQVWSVKIDAIKESAFCFSRITEIAT